MSPPPPLPPPAWKDGKLTLKIPQQMIQTSKESFTYSAIGKFVGRRPSMGALKRRVHSTCRISRPCFISLTELGHFLFRFNTKEDSEALVSQSPISMREGKLLLRLWSPGEEENSWPAVSPVWIRLIGVPSYCWSRDILLSIAALVGEPQRLILSRARVLVNLDVSKPVRSSLSVELEGERTVEVGIVYESVPFYEPVLNETKESSNEMGEVPPMEPRKPSLLQNGGGTINEENRPKSKTMISKWKVIKAGLKVPSRKVRKFFVQRSKKKYKKMAKKVKNYFLLIAVISVLTIAVIHFFVSRSTALPVLALAAVLIASFKFCHDWSCKTQFKEDEKKNHGEEGSGSSALHEKNGDFAAGAKAEVQNIEKEMERFTDSIAKDVDRLQAHLRKVNEDKMRQDKNKANCVLRLMEVSNGIVH